MPHPTTQPAALDVFKRLLTAPVFASDDSKTRTARALHTVLITNVLFSLFFGIWIQLTPELHNVGGLLALMLTFMAPTIPLLILKQQKVRLAGLLFIASTWLLTSASLLVSSGVNTMLGSLYIAVITMALLFFGWRTSLFTVVATLIYTLILSLIDLSTIPKLIVITPVLSWVLLCLSLVLVLIPIGSMYTALLNTLAHAKEQLSAREKAEQALRDNEERFRLISTVTSDYTFYTLIDEEGHWTHQVLSGAFETITGYTPDEFMAVGGWRAIIYPDDAEANKSYTERLHQNQRSTVELRIIRKDGQVRWVRVLAQPIWDAERQKLGGVNGGVQDITDRKLAEQALRDNEERFRLISTVTSDYTFSSRFNAQGELRHKVLSGAFETITGYTPDEFLVLGGWASILHPDDREADKRSVDELRQNQPTISEVRITRKDGQVRWVRVSANPILDDETQTLVGINGGVQDITARKLAEAALQENEKRYRMTTELISDYAYAFDIHNDGTVSCSWVTEQPFKRVSGYDWDDIRAQVMLYHPDDALRARRDSERTARGEPTSGEYRIITASGEIKWLHIQRQVEWGDSKERPLRFYGAAEDITERKQAENALRQSEALLRTVIDHLPDNIYVKDREGKFLINNIESLRRLGVTSQEAVLGKTDFDFFPRALVEQWAEEIRVIMDSGEPELDVEEYQEWHDEPHWILGSIVPLYDIQSTLIGHIGINRDITERKLAEQAIQRSEAWLRALLDSTNDVAFLLSRDYRILTANKPFARAIGKTLEEIIGKHGNSLIPAEAAQPRQVYFDQAVEKREPVRWIDTAGEEQWDNCVYPVLSRDGEVEAFAVFSRNISEETRLAAELQRYATQLEHMVEERTAELRQAKEQIEIILNNTRDAIALAQPNGDIQTRNPAFIAMFGEQVSRCIEGLLWTVSGEEQGYAVGQALVNILHSREGQRIETQIAVDDHGDKDIDLMFIPVALEAEAAQPSILVSAHDITPFKEIERLKARFVADAVHDLATPIAGLTTRLYLLKRSPENLDIHMKALENQVEHFRDLLTDLRTLSQLDRKQMTLDLQTVNIQQSIQRVFDTYEPVALSKDQLLDLLLETDLPDMQLDRRQIERVLLNLVSNAINYSPEGTRIRIRAARDGDELVVSVKDEGIGMSAEEQAHVFERFYRTDRARQTRSSGSGLGLAIVKEIVDLHDGTVSVQSEMGKGSTFTVRLPIR